MSDGQQGGEIAGSNGSRSNNGRLSYKFQRLREAIRNAVVSGELKGRLPGERELGRRFDANAKTINKALSDLTSEGLLVRQIGRGTFVAGTAGSRAAEEKRVHCLVPPGTATAVVDALALRLAGALPPAMRMDTRVNDNVQVGLAEWPAAMRRDARAVLFVSPDPLGGKAAAPSAELLGELHRRQVPVILVGSMGDAERVNAVVPDYADAGYRVAEYLIQSGCDAILPVVAAGCGRETEIALTGMHAAAARYGRAVAARVAAEHFKTDVTVMAGAGRTPGDPARIGVVCLGSAALRAVQARRDADGAAAAAAMVLSAIFAPGDAPATTQGVTTYEFDAARLATRAIEMIAETRVGVRPREVYMPGALRPRSLGPVRSERPFQGNLTAAREPAAMPRELAEVAV